MDESRKGFSIVELLAVIAIIALLLALLLPAIQRVRNTALSIDSANNMRQIVLGSAHYTEANGRLPMCDSRYYFYPNPNTGRYPIFVDLLPYLDQVAWYEFVRKPSSAHDMPTLGYIKCLRNPLDPSWGAMMGKSMNGWSFSNPHLHTSYVANYLVFLNGLPTSFISDGLSQTVFFSERYVFDPHHGLSFLRATDCSTSRDQIVPHNNSPPTFAQQKNCNDDYPVLRDGVTLGSRGRTFDMQPTVESADHLLLQSSSNRGLLQAMGDGSVRFISHGVSENNFWSSITPNWGDLAE